MMLRSVMEDPEADRETLPDLATLKSIVSAFELGTKVGENEDLCDNVFPCAVDKKQVRLQLYTKINFLTENSKDWKRTIESQKIFRLNSIHYLFLIFSTWS